MLELFLQKLHQTPDAIDFSETMALIEQLYHYSPATFHNGDLVNLAGHNEGSCKLFSFARQHQLTELQTLMCFGDYYRKDVLEHPDNKDHGNIRQFMHTGWQGIRFESAALEPISTQEGITHHG